MSDETPAARRRLLMDVLALVLLVLGASGLVVTAYLLHPIAGLGLASAALVGGGVLLGTTGK